jgi:hypothetical protein
MYIYQREVRLFPLESGQRILDLVVLGVFQPDIVVDASCLLLEVSSVGSSISFKALPFVADQSIPPMTYPPGI